MNLPEFEDLLQEAGVFYNGIRGENHTAHMDSYMTCINFNLLEKTWNQLKDKNTKEEWQKLSDELKVHSSSSPNCSILATFLTIKISENPLDFLST